MPILYPSVNQVLIVNSRGLTVRTRTGNVRFAALAIRFAALAKRARARKMDFRVKRPWRFPINFIFT